MNNPITPPPELVEQRWNETQTGGDFVQEFAAFFARWGADQQLKLDADQIAQAYQTGADQELKACCLWLDKQTLCGHHELIPSLRDARRPKPPSLKEQALNLLNNHNNGWTPSPKQWQTIRIAVEALPNDC